MTEAAVGEERSGDASRPEAGLVSARFALTTGAAFAYFLVVGMLIPALPRYVEDELGGSSVAVGVAVGAYGLTAALVRPFVGLAGDRWGRRVLVIGGSLIAAVSLLGYAAADSLGLLVAARLVTGIGAAAAFVGAATAAQDMAPPDRQAAAASYFSVAIYGGQGLGPVLSEVLRTGPGFGAIWGVGIALAVGAAVLGWWVPDGRVPGAAPPKLTLYHRAALVPGSVLMLSVVGIAGFTSFVALHLEDLGTGNAGPLFLLYSAIVLTVRLVAPGLADRRGRKAVGMLGIVLIAAGLALVAAVPATGVVYAGTVVLALGASLQYPALMSLCMEAAPAAERSRAMSSMSLSFDMGFTFGVPLLGVVAELSGYRGAFLAGAVSAAVAWSLLARGAPPDDRPADDRTADDRTAG